MPTPRNSLFYTFMIVNSLEMAIYPVNKTISWGHLSFAINKMLPSSNPSLR